MDLPRHLLRGIGELNRHRRRQVKHLDTLGMQTDSLQDSFDSLHPALCGDITLQVMTVAGQSTRHHDAVGAAFQNVQNLERIQASGAGDLNNLRLRWVLQTQYTGQIGRSISAMVAAKSHDLQLGWSAITHV